MRFIFKNVISPEQEIYININMINV